MTVFRSTPWRAEQKCILIDQSSYGSAQLKTQTNLAAALFRLHRSRSYRDSREVIGNLIAWLREPQYATLRRSFAMWIAARLKPQIRNAMQSMPADLTEVRTMIEENFETWEEVWAYEAIQKGRAEGIEEGVKEGIKEGIKEGVRAGKLEVLKGFLDMRFGELTPVILARLDRSNLPQLERWIQRAYDAHDLGDVFDDQTGLA